MERKTHSDTKLDDFPISTERSHADNDLKNDKDTACFTKYFKRLIITSCWLPKNNFFNMLIVFVLLSFTSWILLFIIFERAALPGGIFFSLIVLLVSGHIFGYLFDKLNLPPLLGMLAVGIFFKNVPGASIIGLSIDSQTSSLLRNIAFCVILCRAGLSLEIESLIKLKWKIAKFSLVPNIFEAVAVGLAAKFLLNLPFTWAFLLGFLLCGVSPAVVVPMMIELKEKEIGTRKNIPTLVIAASCLDNIIAITGFTLVFDVTFSKGDLWWTVGYSFLQILIGLVYGILVAILLSLIRIKFRMNLVSLRFFTLFIMSLIALLGSKKYGLTSAGPWAVLILTTLVKRIWHTIDVHESELSTNMSYKLSKVAETQLGVSELFSKLWILIFLPLMFSLIGNEVDFHKLNLNQIGLGVAVICIGLFFRMLGSYFSVVYSGFNLKEKVFLCISWIPKATVQAAIGSMALDLARELKDSQLVSLGTTILNIAVLSIILTAPLGTLFIAIGSKKLLKTETETIAVI